eukprot:1898353-Pleurochrysis_carterae.AAC.1
MLSVNMPAATANSNTQDKPTMPFKINLDAPKCAEIPVITRNTRKPICPSPGLVPERAATGHHCITTHARSIVGIEMTST